MISSEVSLEMLAAVEAVTTEFCAAYRHDFDPVLGAEPTSELRKLASGRCTRVARLFLTIQRRPGVFDGVPAPLNPEPAFLVLRMLSDCMLSAVSSRAESRALALSADQFEEFNSAVGFDAWLTQMSKHSRV